MATDGTWREVERSSAQATVKKVNIKTENWLRKIQCSQTSWAEASISSI